MLENMKYSEGLTKVSMARDGKAGLGISSGKENLAWNGMVSSKAEGEQMWESHRAPYSPLSYSSYSWHLSCKKWRQN